MGKEPKQIASVLFFCLSPTGSKRTTQYSPDHSFLSHKLMRFAFLTHGVVLLPVPFIFKRWFGSLSVGFGDRP